MVSTKNSRTTFTLPSDREIVLTHVFDAPAELVFKVWTTPEHIERWWGPRGTVMLTCEVDLRVGGAWRYVSAGSDGADVGFYGTFREIEPPTRLVHTEFFDPFPDEESVVTVVLEEHDGKTTLTSTSLYRSREVRDMVLQSGMEAGAAESMERVEELLQTLT